MHLVGFSSMLVTCTDAESAGYVWFYTTEHLSSSSEFCARGIVIASALPEKAVEIRDGTGAKAAT